MNGVVMESEKIKENIRIRRAAEAALTEAERLAPLMAEGGARFWEIITRQAAARVGLDVAAPAENRMSDQEARVFEDTPIPFGVHQGMKVGSISPHYWINTRESDFERDLRRFMKSRRFQEIQDER